MLIRSGISKSEGYVYTGYAEDERGASIIFGVCEFVCREGTDIRYTFSFNTEFVNTKMLKTSLRTAEMCLIMAESYVHSGDTENGLKYLNHLRENRITDILHTRNQITGCRSCRVSPSGCRRETSDTSDGCNIE